MGVLIDPSKDNKEPKKTPAEILDHVSFIEHCDDMLLSPAAAKLERKKSSYQKNQFV